MGIISKTIKRIFYSTKEKRHELVGPPKLWKMKQQFQIDFLKRQELQPHHQFIDIGCGTLRGGIPIIHYLEKGHYCGVDVREEVIKEALKELKEENLEDKAPHVQQFNHFDDLQFAQSFDIMFAFSVLIHMSDDISESCIKFVSNNLAKGGVFYANVNFGDRPDGNWQGYPIVFRSLEFYENIASKYHLKVEAIGTLLELGHHSNSTLGDSQVMLKFTN